LSELAVVCLLQVGDDDLLHLEHGVCHSFGFFRVRVTHQLAQRLASGAGRQSNDSLKLAEPRPVALILPSEIKPVLGRPTNGEGHLTLTDASDSESFSSSPPDHASHWNSGPTTIRRQFAVYHAHIES